MTKEKRGGVRTPGPGKKLGAPKQGKPKPASIQNLPEDLRLALKRYCEDQGRTMAWSIIDMITQYVPPEYLPPE